MIRGTIKLLNSHEIVWKTIKYSGRMKRDKSIAGWIKKHPDICEDGYIQIAPEVNIRLVDEVTGMNTQRKLSEAFKSNMKRPKAEYSNIRSLYGLTNLP